VDIDSYGEGFAVTFQAAGPFVDLSVYSGNYCGILKSDGSLQCSGWNGLGQAPPTVAGHFIAVAVGGDFTCALRVDQGATCFGSNRLVLALGSVMITVCTRFVTCSRVCWLRVCACFW
jgi:hypothetical protein